MAEQRRVRRSHLHRPPQLSTGAHAIARLTKRHVESLLAGYDADPVVALTVALRIVLERPEATWPELLGATGFADTRTAALLVGEEGALDALARELNEVRDLG